MGDAREDQVVEAERRFGVQFPEDYRQFLFNVGGTAGFVPPAEDYLVPYPIDQLAALDEAGQHQKRFPRGLAIGGDGGREVLFYDFRQDPPPLVTLDITAQDWIAAIYQTSSLTEFLDTFPQRGWWFGDEADW